MVTYFCFKNHSAGRKVLAGWIKPMGLLYVFQVHRYSWWLSNLRSQYYTIKRLCATRLVLLQSVHCYGCLSLMLGALNGPLKTTLTDRYLPATNYGIINIVIQNKFRFDFRFWCSFSLFRWSFRNSLLNIRKVIILSKNLRQKSRQRSGNRHTFKHKLIVRVRIYISIPAT